MRCSFVNLVVGLCAGLVTAKPGTACTPSKYTVDTTNGPVTGHLAPGSGSVVEYLGIPYAKPPLGDLRFAPPQKLSGKKAYKAAKYGYDCPLTPGKRVNYPGMTPQAQQIISYFASAAGTPQSEDCLTLNIWTKPSQRSTQAKKPVVVFFYGGRFAIGNTNSPFYNGKYFADAEDIVVVTVNYRINIFGFPGAPGVPQNLGLRDQRAAVEWVRDNAKAFGGDSRKITVAGQSSGGVAVDYWSYAYKQNPIVNGIIATSGDAFSFPVNKPGIPEANWNTVVSAVGCAHAGDVMACMRKANSEDIKIAAGAIKPRPSTSVLRSIPAFYPQPDGEIVFSDYVSRTKAGSFAKVPMFLGHNNNEDGYYRIPAYGNGVEASDRQVKAFLLESFTCPVSHQAEARRRNGVPTWTYRYMADWDNTRLFPTSGAYHGVDMHMIFGASEDVSGLPASSEQKKLTKLMQHAWFAFSDNPSSGLSELGWPQYDPGQKSLIVLGKDNKAQAQFVNPSVYDGDCRTVTMGSLSTPS